MEIDGNTFLAAWFLHTKLNVVTSRKPSVSYCHHVKFKSHILTLICVFEYLLIVSLYKRFCGVGYILKKIFSGISALRNLEQVV